MIVDSLRPHDILRPLGLLLLGTQLVFGQLRIATYNTATSGENSSPATPRSAVEEVLAGIGAEDVNGIVRPIDILVLQEQASLSVSTQAVANMLNDIYGADTYARGRLNGGTNGGGRAGIVYNTQTVDLIQERSFGRLSTSAQARQTLRYQLRPLGYDERSNFYIYVNHYKSGSSATDMRRRNVEATALRANADLLGDDLQAIYAGDFNISSCNEPMFRTLTSDGAAQGLDPMAESVSVCQWKDNSSVRYLHTQSPADSSATGLVLGGVDDRFDFQLVTENLFDGEGLSLIPGSYHAFGNNGTHRMNGPINSQSNSALAQPLLDALADASDHLPVVADYQLPAVMQVASSEVPERVLLGADVTYEVTVANAAPVTNPAGADELDYQLEFDAAGAALANIRGTAVPGTPSHYQIPLPTNVTGETELGISVHSDSQNAMQPFFSVHDSYAVIAPSVGSLHPTNLVERQVVSQVVAQGDSDLEIPFVLQNIAETDAAGLDLESVQWASSSPAVTSLNSLMRLPAGGSHPFTVSIPTSELGRFQNQLQLNISDDLSIWGARSGQLLVDFSVRIALPGDTNLDDSVGFDDFLTFSSNFGRSGVEWLEGDFNLDKQADFADFLLLSRNFGQPFRSSAVPEPDFSSILILAGLLWIFGFRDRMNSFAQDCRPSNRW